MPQQKLWIFLRTQIELHDCHQKICRCVSDRSWLVEESPCLNPIQFWDIKSFSVKNLKILSCNNLSNILLETGCKEMKQQFFTFFAVFNACKGYLKTWGLEPPAARVNVLTHVIDCSHKTEFFMIIGGQQKCLDEALI